MKSFLFTILASLLLTPSLVLADAPVYLGSGQMYKIQSIVDGDTVKIKLGKKTISVRLIGIDTPESNPLRYDYVECFGAEAKKYVTKLLTNKYVQIEIDPSQGSYDKYNRLLGYVILSGQNTNQQIIASGYAREYTYRLPYLYQNNFKQAELTASTNGQGLWGKMACHGQRMSTTQTPASPTPQIPSTPTEQPKIVEQSATCGEKTTCGQMTNCAEATYYLQTCGLTRLDADKDGIPCETICR